VFADAAEGATAFASDAADTVEDALDVAADSWERPQEG
jgi:hypothetical protein